MHTLQYPERPVTFGSSDEEIRATIAAHRDRVREYLTQPNRHCEICDGPIDEPRVCHVQCEIEPSEYMEGQALC